MGERCHPIIHVVASPLSNKLRYPYICLRQNSTTHICSSPTGRLSCCICISPVDYPAASAAQLHAVPACQAPPAAGKGVGAAPVASLWLQSALSGYPVHLPTCEYPPPADDAAPENEKFAS